MVERRFGDLLGNNTNRFPWVIRVVGCSLSKLVSLWRAFELALDVRTH